MSFLWTKIKDGFSRTLTIGPPCSMSPWEANSCPASQPAPSSQCTQAHSSASVWSLSRARLIHCNFFKPCFINMPLTYFSNLRLSLPRELFLSEFPTKMHGFLVSPCPASHVPGLIINTCSRVRIVERLLLLVWAYCVMWMQSALLPYLRLLPAAFAKLLL